MKKIVNITQTTTISKWYASENFSSLDKLCIGKYIPKDNWNDEYIILLNWNISSLFSGLFSFDKVILRLHNMYKPETYNQNLHLYETDSSFDSTTVTWSTRPELINTPIIYPILASNFEESFIDIDITTLIRIGVSGMKLSLSLAITGDPLVDNSIVYFDFNEDLGYPQLLIDYTATDDAFGLFINNAPSSLSDGLVVPGELINGNQVSLVDTPLPNPKPVLKIDYTGIYEINLTLSSDTSSNGYFYFKLGNPEDNIQHFNFLEHIKFNDLTVDELSLIITIEHPSTLLALYYSGSTFIPNSIITSIKRISLNNILEYNLNINPFNGQNSQLIDYHLFAKDSYENMTLGIPDSRTFISGDLSITGDLLDTNSTILLQNITLDGVLDINIKQGSVAIENCDIEHLNIVSCNYYGDGVSIHENTRISSISIINTCKIALKIHSEDISSVKIDSILIHPQALSFEDTTVLLEGHFGMCDFTITRSLILSLESTEIAHPILIDIKDTFKIVSFTGVCKSIFFHLISSITLTGICSMENSYIYIKKSNLLITVDGCFTGINIGISEASTMTLMPNSCINKVLVKTSDNSLSTIQTLSGFELNSIQAFTPVKVVGNLTSTINMLNKYQAMKNSTFIELSPLNSTLERILGVINLLEVYFITEISNDIKLEELQSLAAHKFPYVLLEFQSITQNESLSLGLENKLIKYVPITTSLDNLLKHEAKLFLKISYLDDYLSLPFFLKAMYTDVSIDYDSLTAYVQNSYNSLQYSIDYKTIEKIILSESFSNDHFKLLLHKRDLQIDLNNFELTLQFIKILDSNVSICNGIIHPSEDISSWQSNSYYPKFYNLIFLYIDEFNFESSLTLDGISLDFNFSNSSLLQSITKQVSVIQAGCCDSLFSVNSIQILNSDIHLHCDFLEPSLIDFNIYFSFAKNNRINASSLISNRKCITISSAPLSKSTSIEVSGNELGSHDGSDSFALELVPYDNFEGASLLINGEIILPNFDTPTLIDKINKISSSLITNIPKVFIANTLRKNSWIYIWKNQRKYHKEIIRFNGVSWDILISNLSIYSPDGIYRISKDHGTIKLFPLVTPSTATLFDFEWNISPFDFATISSDGVITALNEGVATVSLLDSITGLVAETKILLKFSDLDAPPIINPSLSDNNLQNLIQLTFIPTELWSKTISTISIVNSHSKILNTSAYELDHSLGIITLNNVVFEEQSRPVPTNLLEVGENIITIHAPNYSNATVTQVLHPRQIVETSQGRSSSFMRFSDTGNFSLEGVLLTGENIRKFSDPLSILVLEAYPPDESFDNSIDVTVSLSVQSTISQLDTSLVSITNENDIPIGNLTYSIDESNIKITISHPPFTFGKTYWVKFIRGSLTLSTGLIEHDVIWHFSIL